MSETTQQSLSNINYKTNEYMERQGFVRKYKMTGVDTILINLFTEYLVINSSQESNKKTILKVASCFPNVFKKFFSFFITYKWYCKISSVDNIINTAHMKNSSFQSSDW